MASGKTTYQSNKIADAQYGAVAYTAPATVYMALLTDAATTAHAAGTGTEPSGNAYARVAVTNNATNFPAASSGSKTNGTVITFPTATGSWGTCNQFAIYDASTSGNMLGWGDLTTPKTITNGDVASFQTGQLTITES